MALVLQTWQIITGDRQEIRTNLNDYYTWYSWGGALLICPPESYHQCRILLYPPEVFEWEHLAQFCDSSNDNDFRLVTFIYHWYCMVFTQSIYMMWIWPILYDHLFYVILTLHIDRSAPIFLHLFSSFFLHFDSSLIISSCHHSCSDVSFMLQSLILFIEEEWQTWTPFHVNILLFISWRL